MTNELKSYPGFGHLTKEIYAAKVLRSARTLKNANFGSIAVQWIAKLSLGTIDTGLR